jgi:hypothetical protein
MNDICNINSLIYDSQIDDSIQNVSEFDVNTLFGCVSQCLQLITGNKDLPTRLPPNISTRFKICGELAQLCQVFSFIVFYIKVIKNIAFSSLMVTKATLVIKHF